MESARSRNIGREMAIVVLLLALLAFLLWLFLRPSEPARDIVFGELGRKISGTNAPSSSLPTASAPPGNFGSSNGQVPMPAMPTNELAAQNRFSTNVPEAGGRTNESGPAPANTASSENSNSPSPSQPSSPAPTPRPIVTKAVPFEDISAPPPEPAYKPSTAALLAQAREAGAGTGAQAPTRTEDLLGNNSPSSRIFDPETGSNVVFIIDNSMSMMTNGKSLAARQAVARSLDLMNVNQNFYILLFHSGGYEGMPSLAPMPAGPQNVRAMTNWLFNVGHRTGADPTKAVQRALGLAQAPDTIWLLSDSEIPDWIVDNVRRANAPVNAHINTIAFWGREGEIGLRRVADENRGTYRYVPPPSGVTP